MFVDQPIANEGTDVVVHIAKIEFRMLSTVDRPYVKTLTKRIVLHSIGEIVPHVIHDFTHRRIQQHVKRALQSGKLIGPAHMPQLHKRSNRRSALLSDRLSFANRST